MTAVVFAPGGGGDKLADLASKFPHLHRPKTRQSCVPSGCQHLSTCYVGHGRSTEPDSSAWDWQTVVVSKINDTKTVMEWWYCSWQKKQEESFSCCSRGPRPCHQLHWRQDQLRPRRREGAQRRPQGEHHARLSWGLHESFYETHTRLFMRPKLDFSWEPN